MKKLISTLAIASLAFTMSAQAAETAAGCGIGAEIMKGKSGRGAQIVASILNTVLVPNTFFMTTGGGLMGCDPTKAVEVDELKKTFVASNMDQLTTDAANGRGDHLTALGVLMGVEAQDLPAFEKLTQSKFELLFTQQADAQQVLSSLHLAMSESAELSQYLTR